MNHANHYLLFDRIQIQAANAISGPLSYGFPSLNGFLTISLDIKPPVSGSREICTRRMCY